MIPLLKPFQPGVQAMLEGDTRVRPTIAAARREDGPAGRKMYRVDGQLYVATPAVFSYLGIDPGTVDPGTDFVVDRSAPVDELGDPEHDGAHGL